MAQHRRNLSVELRVVNFEDPHPTRTFILKSPTYAIRIGRGSKSGNRELFPAVHNAWFDSRVMSREHAVLKADPDTRCVYIEDVGSMHGTHVEDSRIKSRERHRLYDDDLIKFGNEVTRGPESFPPLHVVVRFSWVDDSFGRSQDTPKASQVELPPNTFQVPDDDDEEDMEDDDISFVQETVLKPKLEAVLPAPSRDTQKMQHPNIEVTVPAASGHTTDRIHSNPSPPPSFASSPMPQSSDIMVESSSKAVCTSIAAPGPSGLTEAERQADKRALDFDEYPTTAQVLLMAAEATSPTESLFSPITSSQTVPSEEKSNGRLKLFNNQTSSTPPIHLHEKAAFVDEDLTQSEADLDEAYSPDLMVDDSEDGQRRDTLTDYGSDSDEEALLMADDRDTSVACVADGSTDSTSSRSEYSDDIGMERDEDFFDDTENKAPGTKEVLPSKAYHDFGKGSTEQESNPYNMRPGNFTMPSTRLNLPSNPLNRAPSPSDAAMAKPCDFPTGGSAVQGGMYPYSHQQSWSNPMASVYNPWSCTLDGRNHAPYDERFGGFQYPYGASYAPGQYASECFRAVPSHLPLSHEQTFIPNQSNMKQPDQAASSERIEPQQAPAIPILNAPNGTSAGAYLCPSKPHKSTAKVSIDNIVEKNANEPQAPLEHARLKRKADEIFGETAEEVAQVNPKQVTRAEDAKFAGNALQPKFATIAQVQAIQAMPSTTRCQDERPAKRARIDTETRKTSFTALAATALAGALVGGVGVVAALVSLPQDFFV